MNRPQGDAECFTPPVQSPVIANDPLAALERVRAEGVVTRVQQPVQHMSPEELRAVEEILKKAASMSPHQKLWSISQAQLARLLETAARHSGLEYMHLTLYCMRHGGASDDALRRFRRKHRGIRGYNPPDYPTVRDALEVACHACRACRACRACHA